MTATANPAKSMDSSRRSFLCHDCGHDSFLHSDGKCEFHGASGRCSCQMLCVELTPRQAEVFRLAALGMCAKEIAQQPGRSGQPVSIKTIDSLLSLLYDKFGIHDRRQLLALGLRTGLVRVEDFRLPNITIATL